MARRCSAPLGISGSSSASLHPMIQSDLQVSCCASQTTEYLSCTLFLDMFSLRLVCMTGPLHNRLHPRIWFQQQQTLLQCRSLTAATAVMRATSACSHTASAARSGLMQSTIAKTASQSRPYGNPCCQSHQLQANWKMANPHSPPALNTSPQ